MGKSFSAGFASLQPCFCPLEIKLKPTNNRDIFDSDDNSGDKSSPLVKKINKWLRRDLYFDRHMLFNKLDHSSLEITTDISSHDHFYLSIVCIIKNEDDYLDEWLEFHRLMGVSHFFVYDNGCSQKTKKILMPYIRKKLVTYITFPHVAGSRTTSTLSTRRQPSDQHYAYGDCIRRFGKRTKWLMQLDLDEFVYPTGQSGIDTVADILAHLEQQKYKGVEVFMWDFGSNWHKEKPSGLVIENYQRRTVHPRRAAKSVALTCSIKRLPYSNPHRFYYRRNLIELFRGIKIMRGKQSSGLLRLNHYVTKSYTEYQRKKDSNFMAEKYVDRKFYENELFLNEAEDNRDILCFLPKLQEAMKLGSTK